MLVYTQEVKARFEYEPGLHSGLPHNGKNKVTDLAGRYSACLRFIEDLKNSAVCLCGFLSYVHNLCFSSQRCI